MAQFRDPIHTIRCLNGRSVHDVKYRFAIRNKYFDINKIMNSGQLALIYKLFDNRYICISESRYCFVVVRPNKSYVLCDEVQYWSEYFDLNADYSIYKSDDKFLSKAIEFSKGIRILRRNLWEVIVSFILSQNSNIPNINCMIRNLCETYGSRLYAHYYSFPTSYELRSVKVSDLEKLGFGYRAKYIHNLIQIGNTAWNLTETFHNVDCLQRLNGVGPKVANCIDLYGNHNLESFPIDVHIQDILDREYPDGFDFELEHKGVYQMFMFYYELRKGE